MKILLVKEAGHLFDRDSIGKVHLAGINDSTACGLAIEEYQVKNVQDKEPLTCSSCITALDWAKKVSKFKS